MLTSEIEPVSSVDMMRFLFSWQGLDDKDDGIEELTVALPLSEGCSIPA